MLSTPACASVENGLEYNKDLTKLPIGGVVERHLATLPNLEAVSRNLR